MLDFDGFSRSAQPKTFRPGVPNPTATETSQNPANCESARSSISPPVAHDSVSQGVHFSLLLLQIPSSTRFSVVLLDAQATATADDNEARPEGGEGEGAGEKKEREREEREEEEKKRKRKRRKRKRKRKKKSPDVRSRERAGPCLHRVWCRSSRSCLLSCKCGPFFF